MARRVHEDGSVTYCAEAASQLEALLDAIDPHARETESLCNAGIRLIADREEAVRRLDKLEAMALQMRERVFAQPTHFETVAREAVRRSNGSVRSISTTLRLVAREGSMEAPKSEPPPERYGWDW